MTLVSDVGIWKIVAHIAFKFYSDAFGTFSTGSTPALQPRRFMIASGAAGRKRGLGSALKNQELDDFHNG